MACGRSGAGGVGIGGEDIGTDDVEVIVEMDVVEDDEGEDEVEGGGWNDDGGDVTDGGDIISAVAPDDEDEAGPGVAEGAVIVAELTIVGVSCAAPIACAGVMDGKSRTICGENVLSQTISSSVLAVAEVVVAIAVVVVVVCASSVILGNTNFLVSVLAGGTRPIIWGCDRRPNRREEFVLRRENG